MGLKIFLTQKYHKQKSEPLQILNIYLQKKNTTIIFHGIQDLVSQPCESY